MANRFPKRLILTALLIICVVAISAAFLLSNRSPMADKIEDMIHLPDIIEIEQVTDFRTSYYLGISDVYKITYLSDGLKVHGFVGAPKDYLEKDYPIIIYNRGAAEDEQLILP